MSFKGTPTRVWRRETNDFPTAICFCGTDGPLAVAQGEGPLLLLDPSSGEVVRKLKGHAMGASTVAWVSGANLLMSAGYDGCLRLWDPATGQQSMEMRVGKSLVDLAAPSPDGRLIAATCAKSMKVFTPEGNLVMETDYHKQSPSVMQWEREGKFLATSCAGYFLTWNTEESMQHGLPDHAIETQFALVCMDLDPRGRWAAAGSSDNGLRLIAISESHEDFAAGPYQRAITTLSWCPDGRWLATPNENALVFFDSSRVGGADKETFKMIKSHNARVTSLCFHPAARGVAFSGDKGGRVILHDVETGRVRAEFKAGDSPIEHLHPTRNGIIVADTDGVTQLFRWNV